MLIFKYSHYFLPRYSHFSICATVPQVAQVADNRTTAYGLLEITLNIFVSSFN